MNFKRARTNIQKGLQGEKGKGEYVLILKSQN